MLFIVKIFILIALIRLLEATENPTLCSVLYAGAACVWGLMFQISGQAVLVATGISFALAAIYFGLLHRLEGSFVWWPVMIGGLMIGLV